MAMREPSWAVVATVDEPPALVQAFVAWYLSLGASEVFLYFDRPDDPAAAMQVPDVTVTRCDAGHWVRLGKRRPDKHEIRQLRNATDAYGRMQSDWLLHVDADEFLWVRQPVATCLDSAYPWTDCIVVPVAERVYVEDAPVSSVFSGAFRRPFKGKAEEGVAQFGPDYDLSLRGLTGHAIGKSFTRAGRDLDVSIHRPKPKKNAQLADVETAPGVDMELLHFDGLTPLHWVCKLLRRADAFANHNGMVPSSHRQRQIDAVLGDPRAAFALYDRLKVFDKGRRDGLMQLGLWVDVGFDPTVTFSRTGPEHYIDLSPAAIDTWLWSRSQTLLSHHGISHAS